MESRDWAKQERVSVIEDQDLDAFLLDNEVRKVPDVSLQEEGLGGTFGAGIKHFSTNPMELVRPGKKGLIASLATHDSNKGGGVGVNSHLSMSDVSKKSAKGKPPTAHVTQSQTVKPAELKSLHDS